MTSLKRLLWALLGLLVLALALLAGRIVLELRDTRETRPTSATTPASAAHAPADVIARGEYLARAGNCLACHTARGGAPGAGGAGIPTPFGTVYASNLTPDPATGLGRWSADDFWHALHEGRSRDGRLLYPAFPYPNITHTTRADADAIYAYLQTLPPVNQPAPAHTLRFPYNTQIALAAWRTLYFRPAAFEPDPAQPAEWNRGAYLVQGLGHCNACHASRNVLGATRSALDLGGGLIPMQNWYAPALDAAHEAGVAEWPVADVVQLLKTGSTRQASVIGPMAEVVLHSTQYLSDADLGAIATYLRALPQRASGPRPGVPAERNADRQARGQAVYERHCVACHGARGEGAPGIYPPLAGNRAVTMEPPANLVRIVLGGGFPPATAGNPRPYGMPPFATVLPDEDIAAVITYLRSAWGHQASPITTFEVNRYRTGSTAGGY
ncbi:cytochrome c [Aquincola sp. MAHUQ-54]|uniref:Cytochrome c n=1 Tax=Aquincola agrisoli TaxID=3119538 RepID=A0AAW9QEX6_9BURK